MVALTIEEAERSLCIRCHDGENDPHYKFSERYPWIAHPKLDTYTDPKVHQGLDLTELPIHEAAAEAE